MTKLHNEIKIGAPLEKVWKILADLESVQYYSPMIARARYTSSRREGVGASRHCDFKPKGYAKERVIGWEPKKSISMEMYESEWPVKFMRWKTSLKKDVNQTLVASDTEYELKFGILGKLMDALMMRRKFHKIIDDVFADMKRFIETRSKKS